MFINGQAGIVKREITWACTWQCTSYNICTHQDSIKAFKSIFDLFGRKKRNTCPPYPSDCDCENFVQIIVVKSHTWFPDPHRGAILQVRWDNYKAIPYKSQIAVEDVCGKLSQFTCRTSIGRSTDEESENCDAYCCHAGYLTGFCEGNIKTGIDTSINPSADNPIEYTPNFNINPSCKCTNDMRDAICGPDASFMGIRCPFDRSACARKCCREGKSRGHCRGFLQTRCECF